MKPVSKVVSKYVPVLIDNINTDQITPARYMLALNRSNFARALFGNWRYDSQGKPNPEWVLNRPEMQNRTILLAGDNFGGGSSRECAVWALVDSGFLAVISTSIADIFRNNAVENGVVPVIVTPALHRQLVADPEAEVTVDVDAGMVRLPDGKSEAFPMDAFDRHCLLKGLQKLDFILSQRDAISAFEEDRGC